MSKEKSQRERIEDRLNEKLSNSKKDRRNVLESYNLVQFPNNEDGKSVFINTKLGLTH